MAGPEKRSSDIAFILSQAGKQRFKMIGAALASIVASLLELFPYVLLYQIIMLLVQGNPDNLWSYFIFTVIAAACYIVFFGLSLALSHYSAFSVLHELRINTLEHMGTLNLGFFREKSAGEIKKTIDEDIERLELFIAHQIPDVVSSVVAPLFILAFVATLNWVMALVLLVPVVCSYAVQFYLFRGSAERSREYNDLLVKMHTTIVEYLHGINIFKAFNLTARSFTRFTESTNRYRDYWKSVAARFSGLASIYQLLMDSGLMFSIPLGGLLYLNGWLELSSFILLLLLSSVFMTSFRKMLTLGAGLSRLLTGAKNVRAILEREQQEEVGLVNPATLKGLIEFRDLSFSYTNRTVIHNLSLAIEPGTTVALVGPSGSGKTTLAMLIGRFWDIDQGELLIDGNDIRSIGTRALMTNTSFVFQDVFMLNDSILENIRMGMKATETEVIEAAKKAQIHDFIQSTSNGYQTIIGEGSGIKLSGGEKQRVSIARAILKNAPIVVLDEVTSYSDIENESKIQDALRALLKNRTAIIIAHRLYTIKNVDRIVVLDEGRIVEQATHHELLEKAGLYRTLWQIGMER